MENFYIRALMPILPFILVLIVILLIMYFTDMKENYQDYEPGKAVSPEQTKHYRQTDADYRENDRRDDIVDLEEKMAEYKFDGLDNWPRNDNQGWWGDVIQNKNNPGIYARKIWVWPD
jgi:hypothetical protein